MTGKFEDTLAIQMQQLNTLARVGTPEQQKVARAKLQSIAQLNSEIDLTQTAGILSKIEAMRKRGIISDEGAQFARLGASMATLQPTVQAAIIKGLFGERLEGMKLTAEEKKDKATKAPTPVAQQQQAVWDDPAVKALTTLYPEEAIPILQGKGGMSPKSDALRDMDANYKKTKQMTPELQQYYNIRKQNLAKVGYGPVISDISDPDELKLAEDAQRLGIQPQYFREELANRRSKGQPKVK
jgi:hypothetical protein